jgi:hypothetical protein
MAADERHGLHHRFVDRFGERAADAEAKEEEYMASGTYATVPRPD